MTKTRIINLIGWAFAIFLTIGRVFFSEQFLWVSNGLGGLICLLIGMFLILYKSKPKQ